MIDPQQARAEWLDMRSIQRLVERAVRNPRLPLTDWWPERADAVLGRHWPLVDHEWHRRRTREEAGEEVEELDDHVTRYALMPEGRLVRADRTRSSDGRTGSAAPWVSEVRTLTPRDVRTLDRRAVATSVRRDGTATWGTRPTGEPFLSWPGSGLELLLKGLIA